MAKLSSGTAKAGLTTGIIGTSLAAAPYLLGEGGLLGNLFGGRGTNGCCEPVATKYDICQAEKVSALEAALAASQSEKATDAKLLDLYKFNEEQFAKRDAVAVGIITAEAEQRGELKCMQKTIDRLEARVEVHGVEICEINKVVAVNSERVQALAHSTNARIDSEREAFYAALGCERRERIAGDEAGIAFTECYAVKAKKVIPTEDLCPGVVTRAECPSVASGCGTSNCYSRSRKG